MWVAQRYDIQTLQDEISRHFDYVQPTMIIAPRRSGKTTAITRRFYEETNSAIFYVNSLMAKEMTRDARSRARDVHANHMYSMQNPERIRGKHYDTIYIDDLLWGVRSVDELNNFLSTILPCADRFVAISTPNGTFLPQFANTVNILDILDGNRFYPRQVVREHFKDSEDLFTI